MTANRNRNRTLILDTRRALASTRELIYGIAIHLMGWEGGFFVAEGRGRACDTVVYEAAVNECILAPLGGLFIRVMRKTFGARFLSALQ